MRLTIGMKHKAIVKLRDELTTAIDGNPEGQDALTEVIVYGDVNEHGSVLTINNDDMEREEVPDDAVYADVDED